MSRFGKKFKEWWQSPERKLQGERLGIGLSFALALMAIAALRRELNLERMQNLALLQAALLGLTLLFPKLLGFPAWLIEAAVKAATRLLMYILFIMVYFVVFAPAGIALRLLGKDPLEQKIQPEAETYWVEKKPRAPSRAEHQF